MNSHNRIFAALLDIGLPVGNTAHVQSWLLRRDNFRQARKAALGLPGVGLKCWIEFLSAYGLEEEPTAWISPSHQAARDWAPRKPAGNPTDS